MKDQILAIQELQNIEEIKTATVEILLNLATKIEALENSIASTRETVGVMVGTTKAQSHSHATIG